MSVSYLPQHSTMMISRCHRLKVGSHQIDSSETATTTCHRISRWLPQRLGRLGRKVRMRFHQMWLLKSDTAAPALQLMRWIATSSRMDRRIGMWKINYRSLRHNGDTSLLRWNTGGLLNSVFLTCIISRHAGLGDPEITVKMCIGGPADLRIHVIATCWHASY
jgi:hypothetical protein